MKIISFNCCEALSVVIDIFQPHNNSVLLLTLDDYVTFMCFTFHHDLASLWITDIKLNEKYPQHSRCS